jgi:hypothetical protein
MARALTKSIPWRDARRLPTTDNFHTTTSHPPPSSFININYRQSHLHLARSTYLCPLTCSFSYPQSVRAVVVCLTTRPAEADCPCTSPSLTRARRLYLARCCALLLSSFLSFPYLQSQGCFFTTKARVGGHLFFAISPS